MSTAEPPQLPEDPFTSTAGASTNGYQQRFSHFDAQLFAADATSSPSQAKRALEVHLQETERRIQDAQKLGTSLVKQRQEITEWLKEVDKHESEEELDPTLKQKLVEIENEYNELGKESARAFLGPKGRIPSGEGAPNSPFAADGRPAPSPSTFSSQATHSPSKVNVPTSRKQRNQPSTTKYGIEFATEISHSLLIQVRQLQAQLREQEEIAKSLNLEKSKLETQVEGFDEHIRALNESEQRYKDENWNLETQTHELLAATKEASDRETKLNQALNVANSEKAAALKDLDDLKQSNAKLSEEYSSHKKHHDAELSSLRRNITLGESERGALQRKVAELNGHVEELANAAAARFRQHDEPENKEPESEGLAMDVDVTTPENSPPPSPTKGTPRHTMLESETLKNSLHHAHRMIQNLKGNIHREKTEKLEFKRMLQEARDELELRRGDNGLAGGPGSAGKRRKTNAKDEVFKKPAKPGLLGTMRKSRSEVTLEDPSEDPTWEDHAGDAGQLKTPRAAGFDTGASGVPTDPSDTFETATEGGDAFETADERQATSTETEAFQTGVESMGDSSDELTETEAGPMSVGKPDKRRPAALPMNKPRNRDSVISTASTSDDNDEPMMTPVQPQQQRLRLKINRGAFRRSRVDSEGSMFSNPNSMKNSPQSFISNGGQDGGQSLFAELGDMNGGDDDELEEAEGTPSRSLGFVSTPGSRPSTAKKSPIPRSVRESLPIVEMTDAGTMTEPWIPTPPTPVTAVPTLHEEEREAASRVQSEAQTDPVHMVESGVQFDPTMDSEPPLKDARPSEPLSFSSISSQQVEPVDTVTAKEAPTPLQFSSLHAIDTEPVESLPPASDEAALPIPPPRDSRRDAATPDTAAGSQIKATDSSTNTPKAGLLSSVFGWGRRNSPAQPEIAEDSGLDETTAEPGTDEDGKLPFKDISNNIGQRDLENKENALSTKPAVPETSDQGAQTSLSFDFFEKLNKRDKGKKPTPLTTGDDNLDNIGAQSPTRAGPQSPRPSLKNKRSNESTGSVARARARLAESGGVRSDDLAIKTGRRPGSASSARNSSISHPPLPADHKETIAAMQQRIESQPSNLMGPPLAPASALRANPQTRPRTPSYQNPLSPGSRGGTTPRPRFSNASQMSSPTRSRRSSVTSFASELDERFNIREAGMPMPGGFEGGTDPRMIQAITQTMIGEYLWKYTRKAGRGEMSSNRHRRFFWVHPYTRTLYWSDRDPTTAGRAELKAKSVAIEAVRVITDDNPMPPGLHRKSLIVITPGRAVKFTAVTGQRHETWFNALSYLLLKTGAEGQTAQQDSNQITDQDVEEFNPSFRNRGAAASLSSYNSRGSRMTSPQRATSSFSNYWRPGSASGRPQPQHAQSEQQPQQGSVSRLSHMFRPGSSLRGSFSSRRSRSGFSAKSGGNSIYDASEVHDSAEDLREQIARQDREADRLENVRACCDGKHDVGSLAKKGRHSHSSRHSRQQTHSHA